MNIFNIHLADELIENNGNSTSRGIVTNDVLSENSERIFIITGPNQGGKTTYTQAVALAHFLCQIGLYVPGTQAELSPVDNIYTHYPVEEKPESKIGRLGEESKRLDEIFSQATPYSLILLNESLSSTSPGESLFLSKEIVCAFKVLGARVYFNTHLHELAEKIDEINEQVPGESKVVSLIAGVALKPDEKDEAAHQRTYKVYPAPPLGISYARDIANQYGLSFEALMHKLKNRALIDA